MAIYHKAKGDSVEWWCGLCTYDIVYKSKAFTFTPDIEYEPRADLVVDGDTGYDIKNKLPPEVENMMPDYSLYPKFHDKKKSSCLMISFAESVSGAKRSTPTFELTAYYLADNFRQGDIFPVNC